jgi:4-hydroxy-3-polyprenylbenzoate decarboxylase
VVVDSDVNVHNLQEVIWAVTSRFDPAKDVILIQDSPIDSLDHSTYMPNLGGKLGIDATVKWKEEGFEREWPDAIEMDEDIKNKIDGIWDKLKDILF